MDTSTALLTARSALSRLPIPTDEALLLTRDMRFRRRRSGDSLTSLRSPHRVLQVLVSGTAEVRLPGGERATLDATEMPVFIGEITLLRRALGQTADVVVTSDEAVVGVLSGRRFDRAASRMPGVAAHLENLAASRRAARAAAEDKRRREAIAAYRDALARTAPQRS